MPSRTKIQFPFRLTVNDASIEDVTMLRSLLNRDVKYRAEKREQYGETEMGRREKFFTELLRQISEELDKGYALKHEIERNELLIPCGETGDDMFCACGCGGDDSRCEHWLVAYRDNAEVHANHTCCRVRN